MTHGDTPIPAASTTQRGAVHTRPAEEASTGPSKAELARLTQMAQAGLLAAGLIHDLRNSLTAIKWRCERAQERLSGAEGAEIGRVLEITRTADEGLGAYLGYVRGSRRQTVSPLAEVLRAVRTLSARAGRGSRIPLQIDLEEGLAVKCPGSLLQQVLTNLVVNARQAIASDEGEVRVTGTSQGGMIAIRVEDTGPGIPAEIRETLFEAFATHGKEGGTGLGLFGARQIVEQHGGRLELRWSDGRGTCFEVLLPTAF